MAGKNIVILADGTGQEGGKGHQTNVYRLFNMLSQRTDDQLVFYDPGIGSKTLQFVSKITGYGFSKNLKQCYAFLHEHYRSGDNIYLLGFSRGAATVRSLSGFIDTFGILPQSRPELIKKAYKIYKMFPSPVPGKPGKREREIAEFQRQHTQIWTKVRAIGVWDTVASLGAKTKLGLGVSYLIPGLQPGFHNLRLSPSVEYGYHALSIDDLRTAFTPEIWEKDVMDGQYIEQVWFSGMHTDVGGGYADPALADITLEWMLDRLIPLGLKVFSDARPTLKPDPNGYMHNSRDKLWKKVAFRVRERSWPYYRTDLPIVHPAVLERRKNPQNHDKPPYDPWVLRGDHEVYGHQENGGV